jgi:hypothetical protein
MKTSWINSFLALILTTLVTGCASIVHGPNQAIDFSSQPHGATITIDGKEFGRTPKAIVLRRIGRMKGDFTGKTEYAVKIEMEGFYPYEVKIKREMDGWFLGNIIFGGIIGIIVDASNGSMYKLTPDQVISQMGRPTVMNTTELDDKIYIAVTLNVDPSWEKISTLEKVQ